MTYVGLTKRELLEQMREIPMDAPLYAPVDGVCFGLAKIESAYWIKDQDAADHFGLPLGAGIIEYDQYGAQEVPFEEDE